MDLQNYLDDMLKASRSKSFNNSNQLTLNEIILKIESIINSKPGEELKEALVISYDFGSAIPTTLDSWRGSYGELALGYELTGYDRNDDSHNSERKATDILKELKEAIGKTYVGWKGGDFVMTKNTPVWVANEGNADNTGIVEVVDDGWRILLITQYCEY